jgi:hypothetical protein
MPTIPSGSSWQFSGLAGVMAGQAAPMAYYPHSLEGYAMSESNDPRAHAAKMRRSIDELIHHLRRDISGFHEAKAQALFETAAEVLGGLRNAFDHYEKQTEPAMMEPDTDFAGERSPKRENL